MKKQHLLLLLGASLLVYLLLINIVSSITFSPRENNTNSSGKSEGTNIQLDMGSAVGVSIVRNRWYGQIFEINGSRTLKIFKLIKLPLEKNGKDYVIFHILFSFVWLFMLLKALYIKEYPPTQEFQETKDLNSLNF